MNKKIRLGIVDDHQIVIDGLVSLLQDTPHINISFVTTDGREVSELIAANPIDILLTDVMMPLMPGNVLAKFVKKEYPAIRILALSMSGQGEIVDEMIRDADIAGYALKNISQDELTKAIDKIAGGNIYFSPEVLEELTRVSEIKKTNHAVNLTQRELEIIKLIEKELGNKEIAAALFISERTVETHRKNIFRKTNTSSLIGLVKYAYQQQLI